MISLTLHRPQTGLHPDEPFDGFPVLVGVVGERDFVFFVVLFAEVELDCGAFEDSFVLPACLVDDGGDAAVG